MRWPLGLPPLGYTARQNPEGSVWIFSVIDCTLAARKAPLNYENCNRSWKEWLSERPAVPMVEFVNMLRTKVDTFGHVSVPRPCPAKMEVPGTLRIATAGPITVLIADDDRSTRQELGFILSLQADIRVIGEAANGREALRLATTLMPDVLLLDSTLPERADVDVLQVVTGTLPRTRTIVVSPAAGGEHAVNLLQHGARGVVPKDSPTQLLLKSIRKVHDGELWIDHETVARLVETLTSKPAATPTEPARSFGLTPREREIVGLVVEGEVNKAIAERLSIGVDTVKHHLTNIFDKTGTSNRLELALFALHHRLAANPASEVSATHAGGGHRRAISGPYLNR